MTASRSSPATPTGASSRPSLAARLPRPVLPRGEDGIDSFEQRWKDLQPALAGVKYHYVSLGPGTGDKDRTVLQTMQPAYPEMLYVPVDMSAEMLRMCLQPIRNLPFMRTFRRQLLPVRLDFSDDENLDELHALRDRLMGDEPILWGLLGNTAANLEDDFELIEPGQPAPATGPADAGGGDHLRARSGRARVEFD